MKSLNTKNTSNTRKILVIAGIVAVLGVAAATTYVYAFGGNIFGWQADEYVPLTDQGVKEEQVPLDGEPSGSNLPSKDGETSTDTPTTGANGTQPEKPAIERAGGDPTITVVASFKEASTGYCELKLSKAGQTTLTYKSNIVIGTTYYTCSFKVPRSDLPAGSPWKAVIVHHIGDGQTSSDERDV